MFIKRGRKIIFIFLATIFALSFFVTYGFGFQNAVAAPVPTVNDKARVTDFSFDLSSTWNDQDVDKIYHAIRQTPWSGTTAMGIRDDTTVNTNGENIWYGGHVVYSPTTKESIVCANVLQITEAELDAVLGNESGILPNDPNAKSGKCFAFPVGGKSDAYLITNDTLTYSFGVLKKSGTKFVSYPYSTGNEADWNLFDNYAHLNVPRGPILGAQGGVVGEGGAVQNCPPDPTKNNSAELYAQCWFGNQSGKTYTFHANFDSTANTIKAYLSAGGASDVLPRPQLNFTWQAYEKARGWATNDTNYFVFQNDDFKNVFLVLENDYTSTKKDVPIDDCLQGRGLVVLKDSDFTDPKGVEQLKLESNNIIGSSVGSFNWASSRLLLADDFYTNFLYKIFNMTDAMARDSVTVTDLATAKVCPNISFISQSAAAKYGASEVTQSPDLADANGICTGAIYNNVSQLISPLPGGAMCFMEQQVLNQLDSLFSPLSKTFTDVLLVNTNSNGQASLLSNNVVVLEVSQIFVNFINSLFFFTALVSILITTLKIDLPALSLNTWQLKRMIPTIIITMILINYSLSIANLVISMMDGLVNTFIRVMPAGGTAQLFIFDPKIWLVGGQAWGVIIFRILFLIVFIYITIYLLCLLWLRKIVLIVLYMFAPVAYLSQIIFVDAVKKQVGQWWTYFINWALMGPMVAILLLAAAKALTAFSGPGPGNPGDFPLNSLGAIPAPTGNGMSLTGMILVSVLLYMAATMPLKLGGAAMAALQKQTTTRAAKLGGKAVKAGAKSATGLGAKVLREKTGIDVEDIKKGWTESKRVKREQSKEKAADVRSKIFGGEMDSMADVIENYGSLKGFKKMMGNKPKQEEAKAELAEKNATLKDLQDRGVTGAPLLRAKEEVSAATNKLLLLKPSNVHSRTESLARMGEELKRLSDVTRPEELSAIAKQAVAENKKTLAKAAFSKAASLGAINNFQNDFGYNSGTQGLHQMINKEFIEKLGMSQKEAYELGSDVSYQGEKNGQYDVAKAYAHNGVELSEASLEDQMKVSLFDFEKLDGQQKVIKVTRNSYITERPDGTSYIGKGDPTRGEKDNGGLQRLVAVAPDIRAHYSRYSKSVAENLMKSHLLDTMMGQEGKDAGLTETDIRLIAGRALGLDLKEHEEVINSLDLGALKISLAANKENLSFFKKTLDLNKKKK